MERYRRQGGGVERGGKRRGINIDKGIVFDVTTVISWLQDRYVEDMLLRVGYNIFRLEISWHV